MSKGGAKMRMVPCNNLKDIINHNTETIARMIQRAEKEIDRLKKKNRFITVYGLAFGLAMEFCFMVQNQRIDELEKKLGNLNKEIQELREKEGE